MFCMGSARDCKVVIKVLSKCVPESGKENKCFSFLRLGSFWSAHFPGSFAEPARVADSCPGRRLSLCLCLLLGLTTHGAGKEEGPGLERCHNLEVETGGNLAHVLESHRVELGERSYGGHLWNWMQSPATYRCWDPKPLGKDHGRSETMV